MAGDTPATPSGMYPCTLSSESFKVKEFSAPGSLLIPLHTFLNILDSTRDNLSEGLAVP